jgi:predicted nucleotidyltransferase component of viral defense system
MGGPIEGGPAGAEAMNATYLATARLLTEIAPVVFESGIFALKGGTAINLFLRDMPRLSVDLDLVFTDHRTPRAQALTAINEALRAGRDRLVKSGLKVHAVAAAEMGETKLLVQRDDLAVKVEVNTVIRGVVRPTQIVALTAAASDALMADLELPLLSSEDIYGGKLVAAMDRQHPRDLFDVMELFAHGGITPAIRRAFVVYLASHNRTIHEVLFPTPKDIELAYEGSFLGMTTAPVTLEALLDTRRRLLRELPAALDVDEREFLRSLVRAQPEWSLLDIPHIAELPAIRWRLQNLEQLSRNQPGRFRALADALDERLQR